MNLQKNKKYIVIGFMALLLILFIVSGIIIPLIGIVGTFVTLGGLGYLIYAFLRKKDKRKALGIFAAGVLMFSFASEYTDSPNEEQTVEVKQTSVKKTAADSTATKEAEQMALQEEQKRQEKEARQLEEIENALELAESKPTRENYDKAFTLISSLANEDETYLQQLALIEETVQAEEAKTQAAAAAVEKAEQEQTRTSIDEAAVLVSGLLVQDTDLDNRLAQAESTVAENERLAAEQERKAEEERQAQMAAQKAEEERQAAVAAQQAKETRAAEQQEQAEIVQSTEVAGGVYIAPDSGSKYHFDAHCRGLNNANSVVEMSLSSAQSQGYTLCGWED